jgi:hypothetical protein
MPEPSWDSDEIKKELTKFLKRLNILPVPCGHVTLHVTNGTVGTIEAVAKTVIK